MAIISAVTASVSLNSMRIACTRSRELRPLTYLVLPTGSRSGRWPPVTQIPDGGNPRWVDVIHASVHSRAHIGFVSQPLRRRRLPAWALPPSFWLGCFLLHAIGSQFIIPRSRFGLSPKFRTLAIRDRRM